MRNSTGISNAHDEVLISLVGAIEENLKRVGRTFTSADSQVVEPMGWDSFTEKGITEIRPDGTTIIDGEEQSIARLIHNFDISINEGIAILECLEKL